MVFGQLVMPVQCCAGARRRRVPQHNTAQALPTGQLHIMSLGIKSFATEGVHDGFLDSRWVPGFTIGSWIHDESLRSP